MSKRKYGADTKTSAAFTITKVSLLTPSAFPTAAMFGVPPVYTPTSIPATLALFRDSLGEDQERDRGCDAHGH